MIIGGYFMPTGTADLVISHIPNLQRGTLWQDGASETLALPCFIKNIGASGG